MLLPLTAENAYNHEPTNRLQLRVKQRLEIQADEEVCAVQDARKVGERVPCAASAKGRVLLLEPNVFFRESISDALVTQGYTVVAARDCQEGLREVMTGDFALVLYDPTMPGMRGDMFYSSVERIDMELCERFVFMCSSRIDENTREFIASINGLVVQKPFDAHVMLLSLDLAELRRNSQSLFTPAPTESVLEGAFLPEEESKPAGPFLVEETALAGMTAGNLLHPHAAPVDDDSAMSLEELDATNEFFPDSGKAAALKRGRVLLVEPDPFYRVSIADCLAENGYTVVAVRDTGEAIREMLTGDFALLLYDPRMAGMSPAKFYHSIKRIEPELCERFLFMLDARSDVSTNRFIRKTDGFVLRKPFDPMDLLDALFSAEAGGKFGRIVRRASLDPILSQISPLDYDLPGDEQPAPQPFAVVEKAPSPPAPVAAKPLTETLPFIALPESEPHRFASGFQRALALAALILVLGLVAGLWSRYADARARFETTSAKRLALTTEWTEMSRSLEEAKSLLSNLDHAETQISAFRTKERWTPVLDSIIPNADAMIEILEVEARGETENSGAWEVRVHGLAGGSVPRATADRFRQTVERNLRIKANGRAVSTRFEPLASKNGKGPEQEQSEFIMLATLSPMEPIVAAAREVR